LLTPLLLVGLLRGVDHTTNQHDLVARVVLDGESEGAVGVHILLVLIAIFISKFVAILIALLTLTKDILVRLLLVALLWTIVFVLVVVLIVIVLVLVVLLLILLTLVLLLSRSSSSDALLIDLYSGLMDQFVHMHLLTTLLLGIVLTLPIVIVLLTTTALLRLLLLLASDPGQIGFISIEQVLHSFLLQGLLGVDLVFDLELGQLDVDVLLLLVSVLQQLLELLPVLDLSFLHLSQPVPVLRNDGVERELLVLRWHTDHLDLFVLVVVELALALQHLDLFRLLASQRVESSLPRLLLIAELASPVGLDLSSAGHDDFRVLGDGVLWNGASQFLVGPLRDVLIDLLAALLRMALEIASLHLRVAASSD